MGAMRPANQKRMNARYQEEDADIFDYGLFPALGMDLRGPTWRIEDPADLYCVGSARVFGRFVERPFPQILSEDDGITARNIGFAGCVPSRIYGNAELLAFLKDGPGLPVIQVCAGDGASCDWFESRGARSVALRIDGVAVRNQMALRRMLQARDIRRLYMEAHGLTAQELTKAIREGHTLPMELPKGIIRRGGRMIALLSRKFSPEECVEQIRKCQDWIYAEYEKLAAALDRPALLLYFNSKPLTKLSTDNFIDIARTFPQFFDADLFERISGLFADTLVVVSQEGMPYPRPGGGDAPTKIVKLYPSKEMHALCAGALAKWWAEQGRALAGRT